MLTVGHTNGIVLLEQSQTVWHEQFVGSRIIEVWVHIHNSVIYSTIRLSKNKAETIKTKTSRDSSPLCDEFFSGIEFDYARIAVADRDEEVAGGRDGHSGGHAEVPLIAVRFQCFNPIKSQISEDIKIQR